MFVDSVLPRSIVVYPSLCMRWFDCVVQGEGMCMRVDFVWVVSGVCLGSRGDCEFCGRVFSGTLWPPHQEGGVADMVVMGPVGQLSEW